jgi:hypothetical protein
MKQERLKMAGMYRKIGRAKFFCNFKMAHTAKYAVAQLVEALRYKPEGRGFDSQWCQWNISLT